MKRRTFLQTSTVLVTAAAALPAVSPKDASGFIDTHVSLGAHPYRHTPWGTSAELAIQLRKRGVTQAWTGSFEALFHRDLAAVNARLVESCHAVAPDLLFPVGSVNPTLPAWQDDLKRCAETHGMKAIRLHPNYHGYELTDVRFAELLELAIQQRLLVQIVTQMEDQRTQPALLQVKPVDLKPLPAILDQKPQARVMALNANATMITTALRGCTKLWLDFAMLEGAGGVETLLSSWPHNKLCFGSHAPVFYWESARLKLQESAIEDLALREIVYHNALSALAT